MDPRLLAQAATLFHQIVTQIHPEPCSLDEIDASVRQVADAAGRLTAEIWSQAIVDTVETDAPRCQCGATMWAERRAGRALLLLVGLVRLRLRRYRCPACGAWDCPAATVLHLSPRARLTRTVRELVCEFGLTWSYVVASCRLARYFPGIALSPKTVERLTKECGAQVVAAEEQAVAATEAHAAARAEAHFLGTEVAPPGTAPTLVARPPFERPRRVYVGLDGILVRGRQKKKWLEIQVGTLWSAWTWRTQCHPPRREVQDKTCVARTGGWEALGRLVWHEFRARQGGSRPEGEVVVLGDGASGIRSLWEFFFPQALALLDPWHVWKKVKERARQVLRSREEAWAAARAVYAQLRRGRVDEARRLVANWPTATSVAETQRNRLLAYLERNADTIRDYDGLREQGYMVGGGLTEKTHDLVVVPRMKNGKMHWSPEGANAVAVLRARLLSAPDTPLPS
jgi:hypothetical protein